MSSLLDLILATLQTLYVPFLPERSAKIKHMLNSLTEVKGHDIGWLIRLCELFQQYLLSLFFLERMNQSRN